MIGRALHQDEVTPAMTAWAVSLLGNPFGSTFERSFVINDEGGELDVTARLEVHQNGTKTNPAPHPHPGVTLYLTAERCAACGGRGATGSEDPNVIGAAICDACGGAGHLADFTPTPVPTTEPSPAPETTLAERALAVAVDQLGIAEVPFGSNTGPRVREYLAGCERAGHKLGLTTANWCAAFVGWCDAQAAQEAEDVPTWRAAVAELWADAEAAGEAQGPDYEPNPGDLVIFGRDGHDPRQGGEGHVGRVERYGDGELVTIEGNSRNAVRRVTRVMTQLDAREPIVGWIARG